MESLDEEKKDRPACEPPVRALLRQVLHLPEGEEAEIAFREDLQGAGLDSLNCLELLLALEDWFELQIPEEKLGIQNVRNIADICALVEEAKQDGGIQAL